MPANDTYGRFYLHPQLQEDGSYRDAVYVEIFIKGDKNTSFSRPKKDEDEISYPNAWKSFKDNSPTISDGNPLSMLPGISPSEALNLNAMGILSIEDMAELGEPGLTNINGARNLQKRAKAYLASMAVIDEPEEKADDPVDAEELQNDDTVVPAPRKRGRPKKRA